MQRREGDIRTHFAVSQTPRVQGKGSLEGGQSVE